MTKRGGIHDRAFLASNSERQCSLINPEAQSVVTVFCGSGGALSSPRTQPLVLALDQKLSVRNRVTTFQTGGGGGYEDLSQKCHWTHSGKCRIQCF